jgi:serine/threonine protein kinase HipA of HipAB toxin-antitoxin module
MQEKNIIKRECENLAKDIHLVAENEIKNIAKEVEKIKKEAEKVGEEVESSITEKSVKSTNSNSNSKHFASRRRG